MLEKECKLQNYRFGALQKPTEKNKAVPMNIGTAFVFPLKAPIKGLLLKYKKTPPPQLDIKAAASSWVVLICTRNRIPTTANIEKFRFTILVVSGIGVQLVMPLRGLGWLFRFGSPFALFVVISGDFAGDPIEYWVITHFSSFLAGCWNSGSLTLCGDIIE
jgi:hypothetical protein